MEKLKILLQKDSPAHGFLPGFSEIGKAEVTKWVHAIH